ncbi:tRNA (adenosine(37)-N6)-threonylcarbamoyltransferase complex ATPase subunit type 1 TsaE [Alysiella filiformis]|uniref:tRNA threonylcarbamoyladenosine biosynthesis protein TsaE n=1 Tax=Alysiella filiformis DSM 16848 TaxID=1120981 RepID=A0A286E4Y8_9NEIS|nr:tRNA (adenosine(37)-N6)-threonylcarbamoyltransferase complex ATPase subunit type 1 TsaE [Alysiella filiformis]QMT30435.1 tRNA (adenosine(37)-N6)-threonylcarbamoyltransferase complex ATPase subunit type 1 TsaE [Alysiella filiformis]UBQ56584.1 tRNA (adenosine(37)-N6)-threonylcarbamoyltransferase complex ATPase subunit type 1 TsaE [Alysiella filiformis DSM 16848]SOD65972.1 tRNA threonylcarbamoyladenosine biosynthesis protein TsaE [Alysiella filiformis DSM 16848]
MAQQTFLTDENATLDFGASWAQHLRAPCVVYLSGDLGAGKTTFTRGLLRGLGHQGTVKSPTYAIVESYNLPEKTIHHFDLYRFTSPEEWHDAGLDDLFSGSHIALIEWAQQGGEYVPAADLIFTFSTQGSGRVCTVSAHSNHGIWSLQSWQN